LVFGLDGKLNEIISVENNLKAYLNLAKILLAVTTELKKMRKGRFTKILPSSFQNLLTPFFSSINLIMLFWPICPINQTFVRKAASR